MSKPVEQFRYGAVSAAIWEGTRTVNGKEIPNFNIKIQRSYKLGKDWKNTSSFFLEDLPKVMEAARDAYRYLTSRPVKNERNDADQVNEEPAVDQ